MERKSRARPLRARDETMQDRGRSSLVSSRDRKREKAVIFPDNKQIYTINDVAGGVSIP